METTVCPWCQTEIVWDEELGPESECPHCQNELNEYRTLNIDIDTEEDELATPKLSHTYDEPTSIEPFWEQDIINAPVAFRALDKYESSHDLMNYEEMVEKVLDQQEEVPECPICHEYMLLTGQQQITDSNFQPTKVSFLQSAVLQPPFTVDIYVCSGCFHVHNTLCEADRLRLIEGLSK
ncbi:hypothetical protein [Paenibacillus crassostreae]|uniref:Uncharacterized protein n=1 Tax=Paenibacillus crassostreae TaxID=1763538 RepID=A0A167GTK5_9BACL|nr:hypothetical protein [Paenibacillus crassostreae]AOZ92083.1 hypothetical protein LPB68_07510 [Paenibacillus crassostreae]OAB77892.1 hypothetical protein PNBC_00590 [Paenibacillus crassostreae]